MKHQTKYFPLFLTACSLLAAPLFSDQCLGDCGSKVCGKVDVGVAYVHIDLLTNGNTVERMDVPGVRADLCYSIWNGLVIKPNIMYGYNNEELIMAGCGLGQIIPITKDLKITPVVGYSFSHLDTITDFPVPKIKRLFTSNGGYIGLEASYSITKRIRVYGTYQYAWTSNVTIFNIPEPFAAKLKFKEHSSGSAFSAMIEEDLNDYWSVNVAGAYNNSMSKEKNGMRAYGFKIGLARWF